MFISALKKLNKLNIHFEVVSNYVYKNFTKIEKQKTPLIQYEAPSHVYSRPLYEFSYWL